MRILVFGAGVVGSVYAGRLLLAGHDVVLLARGQRLIDLRSIGLVLVDASSGISTTQAVPVLSSVSPDDRFDLVLVTVRAEQLDEALTVLPTIAGGGDVLFFGNVGGRRAAIVAALGDEALFGFPAVGGSRHGSVVTFVAIRQQRTMLGEPDGSKSSRVQRLQRIFDRAGFPTLISADIGAWLLAHSAFVVPIAFALYRYGVESARLAADQQTMRLMVLATREAFSAVRSTGNGEVPANLRALYRLPTALVVRYWRRVFLGPRGELWFGAHTRAASDEMHTLARDLQESIRATGSPSPHLTQLLSTSAAG